MAVLISISIEIAWSKCNCFLFLVNYNFQLNKLNVTAITPKVIFNYKFLTQFFLILVILYNFKINKRGLTTGFDEMYFSTHVFNQLRAVHCEWTVSFRRFEDNNVHWKLSFEWLHAGTISH